MRVRRRRHSALSATRRCSRSRSPRCSVLAARCSVLGRGTGSFFAARARGRDLDGSNTPRHRATPRDTACALTPPRLCRVRLLVHARSGAAVALKMARGPEAAREAALQRALRHPHVLRCLGDRTHQGHHYMFLEYAQGGDLFDRIGETSTRPGPTHS